MLSIIDQVKCIIIYKMMISISYLDANNMFVLG